MNATIEDFDDDTDLPLPTSSTLAHTGTSGALLEEIGDDDPSDELSFDFEKVAGQGRQWGEGVDAPKRQPGMDKGKGRVQQDLELRPSAAGQATGPAASSPMGGFMGDMMKFQELEEARLAKLRKQMEGVHVAKDPSLFKKWVEFRQEDLLTLLPPSAGIHSTHSILTPRSLPMMAVGSLARTPCGGRRASTSLRLAEAWVFQACTR